MSSKVHSQGNVPFSWENKPGVSKAAAGRQDYHHLAPSPELPPPSCPPENTRISFHHDLQIPLQHASKLPPPPSQQENSRVSFHRDLQIPLQHAAPRPSKLPPPPCPPENSRVSFHDLQIPLQHAAPRPSKLPPPPCPPENSRVSFHDLQIPLPPCAFQPPSRSSSRKGLKKMDDPFLIAYKEVTKSTRKGDQGLGLMKNVSIFSCKRSSCSVVEDSVVRLSQLPLSRSRRHEDYN